jgi:hypothetical protein
MTNMFGIQDTPIGDEAHAVSVQSRYSRHVVISYPSVQDWRSLYDSNHSRDIRASRESYTNMRRDHERSVLRQLDLIHARSSGRAVLSELSAAPHQVLIFPYDFVPSRLWKKKDAGEPKVIAATVANTMQSGLHTIQQGVPICGKTAQGQAACIASPGGGGQTQVFFAASRAAGLVNPDDNLLHELFHATRYMRGLLHFFAMNGGYDNQEEFLATVIQNIYRSENGWPPIGYSGAALANPSAFLDSGISPSPRAVIASLRSKQPDFFAAIANIQTKFNPVRQIDLENKAYVSKAGSK